MIMRKWKIEVILIVPYEYRLETLICDLKWRQKKFIKPFSSAADYVEFHGSRKGVDEAINYIKNNTKSDANIVECIEPIINNFYQGVALPMFPVRHHTGLYNIAYSAGVEKVISWINDYYKNLPDRD